jgi:S-DNA-T family DNA segregation ATPase FtsK/SpoIIIE
LHPEAVLLADNLDLQSEDCNRQLSGLNSLGWTTVLTAGFGPVFQQRVPLAQCARRHGAGILIRPRSLLDGDFFGVRFEPEANPPPGRAVVVLNAQASAVQLADPQPAAPGRILPRNATWLQGGRPTAGPGSK